MNRLTGKVQKRCGDQFTTIDECRATKEKERTLNKPDDLEAQPPVTTEDVRERISQMLAKNQKVIAAKDAAAKRKLRDGADEPEKCAKSAWIEERKQLLCDSVMPPLELLLEERGQANRE